MAATVLGGGAVTRRGLVVWCGFAAALLAGTLSDEPRVTAPRNPQVLAADFHVHAAPGDGVLPTWEVQREAARRGLDVIGITNHNHSLANRIGRLLGLVGPYPVVIDSQELTTPAFHMAAVGVRKMIDWRLPAEEAIAAIHASGGIAIASHPGPESWLVKGDGAMRMLDGVEVAHLGVVFEPDEEANFRKFFERVQQINPDVAAIGASDFHFGGPIGSCRTYVLVDGVSREAVLDAVRQGRTVATCPGGRVTGREEHLRVARDRMEVEQPTQFGYGLSTWLSLATLMALGVAVLPR